MKNLNETPEFTPEVPVPEDGVDRRTASSLYGAFQALANRTRKLIDMVTGQGPGIHVKSSQGNTGSVFGESDAPPWVGEGFAGVGVRGKSINGAGVRGESEMSTGVFGRTESATASGVQGTSVGGGAGVSANTAAGTGPAIRATGNTTRGTLALDPGAEPSTDVAGDIYFDDADKALRVNDGNAYKSIVTLESNGKVPDAQLGRGQANGVASLDGDGRVPQEQMGGTAATAWLRAAGATVLDASDKDGVELAITGDGKGIRVSGSDWATPGCIIATSNEVARPGGGAPAVVVAEFTLSFVVVQFLDPETGAVLELSSSEHLFAFSLVKFA